MPRRPHPSRPRIAPAGRGLGGESGPTRSRPCPAHPRRPPRPPRPPHLPRPPRRHTTPLAKALFLSVLAAALAAIGNVGGETRADASSPGQAGYIRIEGVIDRLQSRYLARALADARTAGLRTIVLHLDTDGGQVHYAREMFKAVLEPWKEAAGGELDPSGPAADPEGADGTPEPEAARSPRMIAFVDFRALSAGAMIAYAHHEIYVAEGASIGDIGVIYRGPDGKIEYAPEKIETVVRTLLAQAAEQRGWPRGPLLKMTARNQNLYRITPPGGETIYVIEDDLAAWLADHPEVDREDSAQVLVYRGHDRLLTLTGREAVALGMASGLADGLPTLYAHLGIDPDEVLDLRPGAAERTATWLAGIAPILMGLALLLLFFEINTPGVGIWALLAAVFGSLFLFAQYYLDLVEHFEVALLVLGIALIAVELVLLPAGGLIAIGGALCLLAGAVLAFLPNELDLAPSDPNFQDALFDAALQGGLGLAGAGAALLLLFKVVPHASRLRSRLTVEAEIAGTSDARGESLVGRVGRAEGMLRPAGTVVIGRAHHSARAEHGTWIAAGEPVEVVGTELGELVVRARSPGGEAPRGG